MRSYGDFMFIPIEKMSLKFFAQNFTKCIFYYPFLYVNKKNSADFGKKINIYYSNGRVYKKKKPSKDGD
jgi:hypothetical protein